MTPTRHRRGHSEYTWWVLVLAIVISSIAGARRNDVEFISKLLADVTVGLVIILYHP